MSRLHYAARRGKLQLLTEGIRAGLDLDEREAHHFTPLLLAAQAGRTECVGALLAAGANPYAAHPNGRTALHFAASGGHFEVVRALVEFGVPPDVGHARSTAALEAAMFNRVAIAEYLIAQGADPTVMDRQGRSVLRWIELGGVQGVADSPPKRSSRMLPKIRKLMAEFPSVEEYAAHRGRRILVFSYSFMDLSSDPEADTWAKRLYEILGDRALLAECEDRFLQGEELAEVQKVRERNHGAEARRSARGANDDAQPS
jgi:hypothetical protein